MPNDLATRTADAIEAYEFARSVVRSIDDEDLPLRRAALDQAANAWQGILDLVPELRKVS